MNGEREYVKLLNAYRSYSCASIIELDAEMHYLLFWWFW